MIGGIAETQEMLDFCAEHDVAPEIEVIEPDYINEAYERVLASDVRYRFVIDTASLRDGELRRRCVSSPRSGQPAAASLAATRWTFSGPASCWVTSLMNSAISSRVISPSADAPAPASVRLRTTSLIWSSVNGVARSSASSGTRSGPGTPSG